MQALGTMLNNDNEVSIRNNNVNDNVSYDYNKQDEIADKLCEQLGNKQYRAFYCKVANSLSEAQIWSSLELAKTGKSPARYFTWLVKKQMSRS